MSPKLPQATPNAMHIEDALGRNASLARLKQQLRDSQSRFEAIRPFLPATLASYTKPGPVDAQGWSLLVANASVAAKLRQLQPRLEQALKAQGWQVSDIRVKVQTG